MPEIGISVQNKITSVISGTPRIICGNNDYTLTFTFDEEFSAYAEKTLCIVYRRRGKMVKDEVLFTGDTVALPVLYETDMCAIGVYAGNLISSTVVMIPCDYCAETEHHDPPPDIYEQLLEYLAGMQGGGAQVGNAVTVTRGTMLTHVGQAQRVSTVIDMMDYEWETGSGNTNTGAFDNDVSTRLRCNKFIPVPANRYSALISAFSTGGVGLESVIYWYTTDSVSGYIGFHNWSANGTDLTVPEGTRYFRLNLKIDNETDMVPADLASCAVTFLS